MEPATWGFIGTITGTIVGATASIYATYLNGKNTLSIQQSTENYKRKDRFREFQRNNLLKIQDEFSSCMRLIGSSYSEFNSSYKKTDKWFNTKLSEEVNFGLADSFRELLKLTERIENDDLRGNSTKLRENMSMFLIARSKNEGDKRMAELVDNFTDLMKELGIELRNNY